MGHSEIYLKVGILPFMASVVTFITFLIIGISILTSLVKYARNSISPLESAKSTVVSKRSFINYRNRTEYFITFEFENKERKEYKVKENDFGLIVEGDKGVLTFQGVLFKKFERSIQ